MSVQRIDSLYDVDKILKEASIVQASTAQSEAALNELYNTINQFKKTSTAGTISDQWAKVNTSMVGVIDAAAQLKTSQEKLNQTYSDAAKKIAEVKVQTQLSNKANQDAAKEALGLTGAFDKLNKQWIEAQKNAKNMVVQYGAQSEQAKKAVTAANQLGQQITTANKAVGNFRENVGNYKSALEGVHGLLEELSTAGVAFIGIQNAFEFLKESIDEFKNAELASGRLQNILHNLGREDAFEELKKSAEDFAHEFKTIKEEDVTDVFQKLITYGKLSENQIKQLTPVIINFAAQTGRTLQESAEAVIKAMEGNSRGLRDFGINIKDGHDAVERFNIIMEELAPRVEGAAKAFGKTFAGQIKETSVAIDEIKKKIGEQLAPVVKDFLEFIEHSLEGLMDLGKGVKDVFDRIYDITTKYHTKPAQDAKNLIDDIREQQKKQEDANNQLADYFIDGDNFAKKNHEEQEKMLKNYQHETDMRNAMLSKAISTHADQKIIENYTQQLNLAIKIQEKAEQISKANTTLGFGDDHKHDTEEIKKEIEAYEKLLELREKEQLYKLKLVSDDKYQLGNTRIDSLKKQLAIEENFIKQKAQIELKQDNLNADQTTYIRENAAFEIYQKQIQYSIAIGKVKEDEVKKEADLQKETTDFFKKQEDERTKKAKDEQDKRNKIHQESQNVYAGVQHSQNVDESQERIANNKKYVQGLIDEDQFNQNKEKIRIKYERAAAANEINRLEDEQRFSGKSLAIDDALAQQRKKLSDLDVEEYANAQSKKAKIIGGLKELELQGEALFKDIIDARYENELNHIQDLIDANTKLKDAELLRIKDSTLSEQDKANKIAVINATYQAQNEQLALQQKKIKHEQAVADKEYNVAHAIEEGILATLSALKSGGPVYAAIVAAIAAVQIAKIIATPIPSYFSGTESHPGGLANVHEGEIISEPGKELYYTGNISQQTMNLSKHSKVIPKKDVDRMINESAGRMYVNQFGKLIFKDDNKKELETLTDAVNNQTRILSRAFAKAKVPIIKVNVLDSNYLNTRIYK